MMLSIRNKAAFTRTKIYRENAISVSIHEVLINELDDRNIAHKANYACALAV